MSGEGAEARELLAQPTRSGRRELSDATWLVIDGLLEALVSDRPEGGALVGASAAMRRRVVPEFDDWVRHGSQMLRLALPALLWLIELMPLFVVGRFSRMSRLPLDARLHYLESLEAHPIGLFATAFMGVRTPILLLVWEEGDELRETGFDRETVSTPRKLPLTGGVRGGP